MNRDPRLKSKWWRINHLYKILDKEGNLITFKPSRVQLFIIIALRNVRRLRILKYRQGGVTTLFCILYLDDALWTPGFSSAIIAHERGALDKIFEIVARAYDNMPEELKPSTDRNTLRMLRFKETFDKQKLDSQIYVALKLRSGTVQALHITERAYITGDKSRELEAGSKQAVPLTGTITEESTANGFNEYFDAFMDDLNNDRPTELDYKSVFFAWHEDSQYSLPGKIEQYTEQDLELKAKVRKAYDKDLTDEQLLWYRWKMQELKKAARESDDKVGLSGIQLMRQEYPSTLLEAFQSGLGNVFDNDLIDAYDPVSPIRVMKSQDLPSEPEETIRGEEIDVIEEPQAGENYVVGVDPSDGSGDPAGIAVWTTSYRKVAQWSGRLRPDKLAKLTKGIATMYNDAYCGVENNMLSTILFLSQIYTNYFFTVKIDQKRQTKTKKMGWTTTGKSRDIMIDDFIMHFEEGTLENITKLTLGQMKTFIAKEGGKREHADGKNDDMLFADMIAIQMIKYWQRAHKKRSFSSKPGSL